MARRILEDVIRKKKPDVYKFDYIKLPPQEKIKRKRSPKLFLKIFLWLFLILLITLLLMLIGNLFASALVKITPKQDTVSIDFNAKAARKNGGEDLSFEIIQMTYEASQPLEATTIKEVSEKAKGIVAIYNNFSSAPQVLIKNTRLESPGGKIYRISKTITIPGQEIKNGRTVPGSIEVEIYADKPGENFNIGLSDFTIPGFKGDPQYEKIYGRSKTEIKGGFMGKTYVLEEKDIANARNSAKKKVENYIRENIFKQKLSGLLFYNNALIIAFDDSIENPKSGEIGQKFTFKAKGTGTGFLVSAGDLTKEIVKRYLNEALIQQVRIINLDKLEFNLLSHDEENTAITFNLKGKAHIVWEVNLDYLLSDLTTEKGGDYDAVFKRYPAIEKAEIIFKPSWWRDLPKNKSRIQFEEILNTE